MPNHPILPHAFSFEREVCFAAQNLRFSPPNDDFVAKKGRKRVLIATQYTIKAS